MATILPYDPAAASTPVVPGSSISEWLVVIDEGGLLTSDGPLVRSKSEITNTDCLEFKQDAGMGTTLRVRIRYDATKVDADEPPPVIKIFAAGDDELYAPLRNRDNQTSVELPYDPATDPWFTVTGLSSSQDYNVTVPDNTAHSWDCDGCKVFIIAVERAIQGSTGGGGIFVEAKII